MPHRSYASTANYRFGFNGKENDNESKGLGNQQDYGMRIYDARLGRFLSVDPLIDKYPELTPYQFTNNSPIANLDLDGQEDLYYSLVGNAKTGKVELTLTKVDKSWYDKFTPSAVYINGHYMGSTFTFDQAKSLAASYGNYTIDQWNDKLASDAAEQEAIQKQRFDYITPAFSAGYAGGAMQSPGTYTNTTKQLQAANGKTNTDGSKNSTSETTPSAGSQTNAVKTKPAGAIAGKQAAPIVANKANSLTSEQIVEQKLRANLTSNEAILPKPRIYIGDGSSGKYAVPDFVIYNKNTGKFIRLVDAKDSNATLSKAQEQVNQYGGTFNGSSRAKDAKPQSVAPNSIQVERTNVGGSN